MKIVNKIFSPHGDIQRDIMHFLAGDGPPYILWVSCGTKFGKTLGACGGMALAAPRKEKTTWRIVAPIYKQVRVSWKYMDSIWPGKPYVEKNKTDMTMHLPGRKIDLQFWHGQSPEDLEGEGIHGQINDECAKLKEGVFTSSRTTFTRTQGRMLNISTPRGRNWFHKGCMRAIEEMERAKFEGRKPREMFLTAPTLANPNIPAEAVDEARRLLPVRLFEQYYNAVFVEDGQVFPIPKIDDNWLMPYEADGPIQFWLRRDHAELSVVAGCDWAKKQDFTVLTVWDYTKRPFRMVGFLRMQGRRYTEQVVDVARFLRKFKDCEMLYHDKTGVGEAIDDMLEQVPGLVYDGKIFSNASKSYMVNNLIGCMERDEILFPWWPELQKEFENFEVETTDLGNMVYQAGEGYHDDIPFSCCLGISACMEFSDRVFEVRFLEDLPTLGQQKDTIENYFLESLDIDPDEGF